MMQRSKMFITALLGIGSLFLALTIIFYPEETFHASLRGLRIWWDVVFPALLPFIIAAEFLMGMGVVHFLGVLLQPIMHPLFRVPGTGGFVLAMGFASGYPVGAKLTVRLRQQNLINQYEGERLVAFASTSDPIFIFGAVAVGLFHDARLGLILASSHYLSSLLVGFAMSFHERDRANTPFKVERRTLLRQAFRAMHQARLEDSRPFATLMSDAIYSGLKTTFLIGGFIMIFSVLLQLLTLIKVSSLLQVLITLFFLPLGFSTEMVEATLHGLFEITMGAQGISLTSAQIPLMEKMILVSFLLSWSGFSIHAQVASILSETDIRYTPYLVARLLHAFLASLLTYLAWNPFFVAMMTPTAIPAFLTLVPANHLGSMLQRLGVLTLLFVSMLLVLLIIALLFRLIRRLHSIHVK